MKSLPVAHGGASLPHSGSFSTVADFLIVHLFDNFSATDVESLEMILLQELHQKTHLRGVLFNFNQVVSTDCHDLLRLSQLLKSIRLLGARVGLCGINPGLASVIVAYDIDFRGELIGSDLDDLLARL